MNSTFSTITGRIRKATVHIAICNLQNDAQGKFENIVSSGSGFFISENGWLLTSHHVVQQFVHGRQKILAVFKENETTVSFSEAHKIDFQFPEVDLCVIKFDQLPANASFAEVSTALPEQGENIGLFGYPDSWLAYEGTGFANQLLRPRVAKCVLARNEIGDFQALRIQQKRLLETQFSFVKGNSGGPIFSEESGKVVGLVMGFQNFPQSAFACAVVHRNCDKQMTGEVLPLPAYLNPGFYWEQVAAIKLITYSYGIACDEILKCLADPTVHQQIRSEG